MVSWPVIALSAIVLVVALYFSELDLAAPLYALSDLMDRKLYARFIEDCDPLSSTSTAGDDGSTGAQTGALHVVYPVATSFPGLLSSMLSVTRHLESPGECVIHIIVADSQKFDTARRIADCFEVELDALAASPTVKIHTMRSVPFNFSSFSEVWESSGFQRNSPWFPSDYALLYVPEYVLDASRAVWLNPNTIVKADLSKLASMPMRHAVAAARDMKSVTWRSEYERMLDDLDDSLLKRVSDVGARLFNMGVLVLDLERWRAENITGKLEAWVERLYGIGDAELAANIEFLENFDVIDWRWHVYIIPSPQPPSQCIDEARIFHWLGLYPWSEHISPQYNEIYSKLTGPSDFLQRCKWNVTGLMLDSDVDVDIPGLAAE